MVNVKNYYDNPNVLVVEELGLAKVLEFQKDYTMNPMAAQTLYFCDKMGVKKRQVTLDMKNTEVSVQAGAMQWTLGNIESQTGIKGAGDFLGKMVKGAVTGETAVKPVYKGSGLLVLEPTYKYVLLEDVSKWNGGMVLDDGMFLACENTVKQEISRRNNLSSAIAGGEGIFNLCLAGSGVAVLESPVPREELIEINLENDMVRIDGNYAVAWSKSLQFTVERSSKSLLGSAVNGEGLVNVYRGTGKILMAPVR